MKQAGTPWWMFLFLGCLWLLLCALMPPLYDLGVWIRRRLGMVWFADFAERIRPKILPPTRLALLIMGVASIVFAFI